MEKLTEKQCRDGLVVLGVVSGIVSIASLLLHSYMDGLLPRQ